MERANIERGIGITEAMKKLAEVQKSVRDISSTPSGVNVIPQLIADVRSKGSPITIGPCSKHLDNIPRFLRNHILLGGTLVVTETGVLKIPVYKIPNGSVSNNH